MSTDTPTPEYRLEAAPGAPGILTPVSNRTGRSPLVNYGGTPAILGIATANLILAALNAKSTPPPERSCGCREDETCELTGQPGTTPTPERDICLHWGHRDPSRCGHCTGVSS